MLGWKGKQRERGAGRVVQSGGRLAPAQRSSAALAATPGAEGGLPLAAKVEPQPNSEVFFMILRREGEGGADSMGRVRNEGCASRPPAQGKPKAQWHTMVQRPGHPCLPRT